MSKTPNPTDVFVGKRVRQARNLAGVSQEKLGDACGLTFQQIQKYEKGANRIGASRMVQIAKALGQPTSYFFPTAEGTEGGTDALLQLGQDHRGIKLAENFNRLPAQMQSKVADFVEALAASEQARR